MKLKPMFAPNSISQQAILNINKHLYKNVTSTNESWIYNLT